MHSKSCICAGTGYVSCSSCGGIGTISDLEYVTITRTGWDGQTIYDRSPQTVRKSCTSCAGLGKSVCRSTAWLDNDIPTTTYNLSIQGLSYIDDTTTGKFSPGKSGLILWKRQYTRASTIYIYDDYHGMGIMGHHYIKYMWEEWEGGSVPPTVEQADSSEFKGSCLIEKPLGTHKFIAQVGDPKIRGIAVSPLPEKVFEIEFKRGKIAVFEISF